MSRCYVALGSNLGEPLAQLRAAVQALAALPDSRLAEVSSCYRSSAVGPGAQPDYLNAVVALDTRLAPLALLDRLQAIENAQGRVRTERWGARTLDLDILLFGDQRITDERLQVPHPRLAERNFVLYPLAEIAGHKMMLPDGRELDNLLAACPRGELAQLSFSLV